MRQGFLFSTAALIFGFVLTLAPVWAGSNFEGGSYPAPDCGEQPTLPTRPEAFEVEADVVEYNQEVEQYNALMEAYVGCVQRYVDNAAQDIRTIKAKSKAVVEPANN